jgi:hypothetical protein
MTTDQYEALSGLRTALNKHSESWDMDPDLEGAIWLVRRAIDGRGDVPTAIREARSVLAAIEQRQAPAKPLTVRTITKDEHDSLVGDTGPRGVSREDYERMMREAQE